MHSNPYLSADAASAKGGPLSIEDPHAVTNIVFQTRSGPLAAFEDRLADALMGVFADGADEIDTVVAGLNAAGSVDSNGDQWTGESFAAQMHASAALLFAKREGAANAET